MTENNRVEAEVLRAMDDGGWRPIHTRILIVLGLGWMLDAFEVTLVGNVLPILKHIWALSAFESTLAISLWLAGILVGALGFGWAADRYGRRRLFVLTLLLYAVATFATAFSVNYWMFIVLRVVAAVGVGAEYSAVNAAVVELMPTRWRGRAGALVMAFWPLGALLGGGLTLGLLAVLPATLAWRAVFGLGALIALFVLWARRVLPESPRWLIGQGRYQDALAACARLASVDTAAGGRSEAGKQVSRAPVETPPVCKDVPARLALGAALDFSEAGGFYGLFALIPLAVIPSLHLSYSGAPLFYLIGSAGALVGALLAAWLIERSGRKHTVVGFYASAALLLVAMAFAVDSGALATLGVFILVSAATNGSWVAAYPTFAEIFPTRSRATGIGASVAVGRVAAALSPPLLVLVAGHFSTAAALATAALFYLFGVLAMGLWSLYRPDSAGRTLESLVGSE